MLPLDALHAELAEIDENLIRHDLTRLERGEHLARRKELYEALHPQTRQGGAGRRGSGKGEKVSKSDTMSFSEDSAKKTGRSERSVHRDVKIGTGLAVDTKERLRQTPVANDATALEALSRLPEDQQREAVDEIERSPRRDGKAARTAVAKVKREPRGPVGSTTGARFRAPRPKTDAQNRPRIDDRRSVDTEGRVPIGTETARAPQGGPTAPVAKDRYWGLLILNAAS